MDMSYLILHGQTTRGTQTKRLATKTVAKTPSDIIDKVSFSGTSKNTKPAIKALKKIGSIIGVIGLSILSALASLLPGDSINDKKIKTGINDKDTSDYKGTSASDLYNHYAK